jgi:peptidoglycan/LPS O-acetylase OafA/YrhL
MQLKYYKNLDGVRAIAALMIIVFHFFGLIHTYKNSWIPIATKLSEFGQTGVSLFFVLSGFVITRILIKSKDSESYFKSFYLRRMLRIFPLYYLYLLIFFFLVPLIKSVEIVPFSNQLGSYFYLQNFAMTFQWQGFSNPDHFWSLAVEEHFYLFWPLLIYYLPTKRLPQIVSIVFIISLITKHLLLTHGYIIGYFTFTRIDQLGLGALLAYYEFNGFLNQSKSKMFLIFIVLGAALVGFTIVFQDINYYFKEMIKYPILGFFYFSCTGWLIINTGSNLVNKFLELRFFKFSGKISYGLYVYHPLAILLLEHYFYTGNIYADFVLVFLITYIIAFLSFNYFESKFLVFKNKFSY